MRLKKPFIILQNGVEGVKKLREQGKYLDNNILRLFCYNKFLKEKLIEANDFRDYQLKYTYQPKYGELIRNITNDGNQILWFLEDRVYLYEDMIHVKSFASLIKRITEDKQFIDYLKGNGLTLKICTDAIIKDYIFDEYKKYETDLVKIVKQEDINLQKEIASSKVLITDYSPYVYDAAFIEKPYVIFQPDLNKFLMKTSVFYDDELKDSIIKKPSELIDILINEEYQKADYIESAIPDEIDFDFFINDKHLDEIYDYLRNLQFNKITFLGYNFYGIGGTVNATMALAESLLQEGYWVDALSLKRNTELRHRPPYGLNMQYLSWDNSGSIVEKINRRRYRSPKYYGHLEYDYVKKFLSPYVGYKLDDLMKNIKTNTLVSTRESLHLFLNDCVSENVKNKVFFYHTPADIIDDIFPGLINKLNEISISNAVFITEQNRLGLEKNFNYTNYGRYINLGNTLIQAKRIEKDEILPIEKKEKYSAIYLLRISKGREKDLNNLIEFGKYVKENNIDFIEVDVFGDGDYVEQFLKLIETNDLSNIIHYKLSTDSPIEEIREHDFMIDFSLNHSFGMIYIEAVLNGKKVFCMENIGSTEVMEGIPNSYIQSHEWLIDQIINVDKITVEELRDNYDKISEKYSQKAIAGKFLEFINGE